jgi:hypothetical protein
MYRLIQFSFLTTILLAISLNLFSQATGDYRSTGSGNWDAAIWERYDGSSWVAPGANGYPGENTGTGVVTIRNGHSVTLNVSPSNNIGALSLTNSSTELVLSGTNSLTIAGAITFSDPVTNSTAQTINVGDGSISCAAVNMVNPGGSGRTNTVVISNGELTSFGDITTPGAPAENLVTVTGTGTINVGGNFTGGTFTCGTGTVNFNGNVAQNVGGFTYHHLQISGSNTKALQGTTSIGGNLNVDGGTLELTNRTITVTGTSSITGTLNDNSNNGTNTFIGQVTINTGGQWLTTYETTVTEMIFRNGITNNGTFTAGAAQFDSNSQTIDGSGETSFANDVRIEGDITLTNDISHANGLIISGNLNGNGGTGLSAFRNNDNRTFDYRGTNSPMSTYTFDVDQTGNTVIYNRNGVQTVKNTTYHNLSFANGSSKTLASNLDLAITNNLSIAISTTFIVRDADETGTLTIGGTLSNDGIINLRRTATRYMNVVLTQNTNTISGNGSYTFNTLTIAGDVVAWSSTSQISMYGNFINNTTTSLSIAAGTFYFDNGGNQTIGGSSPTTFNNLNINNSDIILNRNTTVTSVFTMSNGSTTINLNTYDLSLNGSYVRNNGAFIGNAASNLILNCIATNQILDFATTFNLNNLTINNSSASYLLSDNLVVESLTSIAGILQNDVNSRTLTVNSDIIIDSGFTLRSNQSVAANTIFTIITTGNYVNNGTTDLYHLNGTFHSLGEIQFTGLGNVSISGSQTPEFGRIRVNKGTDNTNIVDVTIPITLLTANNVYTQTLFITNGTFKLSSASNLLPYYGDITLFSTTARLWLNHNNCSIGWSGSYGFGQFSGIMQINEGTFTLGDGNDYLLVINSGHLILNGGTIKIYGRFATDNGVAPSNSSVTISGGELIVDPQHNVALANNVQLVNFVPNCIVNFTGGKLTVVDPHLAKDAITRNSVEITGLASTKNFIGSTIQFGDGVSTSDGNATYPGFTIYTQNPIQLGNIILNNPGGNNRQYIGRDNTHIYANDLIITTPNDEYRTTGRILDIKGNLVNNGTLTANSGASHLIFSGTEAQSFSGSGTVTATIPTLTFNNTSATGVTLESPLGATTVNLTDGHVYTSPTGLLTVFGTNPTTNLVGGGVDNFVSGPLRRSIAPLASTNYIFPVGEGSNYRAFEMEGVVTTGSGNGFITAQAISGQTGGTGGTGLVSSLNAEDTYWKIDNALNTVSLSSVNKIKVYYTKPLDPQKVIGQSNTTIGGVYNPIGGTQVGNYVESDVSGYSFSGINPTGTSYLVLAEVNSGRTWYSLISGDWDNWETWTLDPSGALPNNPGMHTPTTSPSWDVDDVVILNGKTVTVNSNAKVNDLLTVSGRLDINTTGSHVFNKILGSGRILLKGDNFPAGDASNFYTEGLGAGTVVYQGAGYDLNTTRTFYNVEIEMDNAAATATLLKDYTINGNLLVKNGILRINDDASTTILNLTVNKDVSVEPNGSVIVGTGNTIGTFAIPGNVPTYFHSIFHQFKVYGNFINNGIVKLTNQTAPVYNAFTSSGGVTLTMLGTSNTNLTLNNTAWLYNLIVDKGIDKTYELNLFSSDVTNFVLFGPNSTGRDAPAPYTTSNPQVRKALWVKNGTLKLTGNINIPTLSEGLEAGGNGDYTIGQNARLWIAGPNVTVYTTASNVSQITGFPAAIGVNTGSSNQALSLYGEFKITDGFFGTRNSAGFIFWATADAQVKIEGGVSNVSQFRTGGSSGGVASYIQTGGQMIVRGNSVAEPGEVDNDKPIFGFDDATGVFNMSGGEILIRANTTVATGDLYLPCAVGNYSVTGGKVTIELPGGQNFEINSVPNFWDLEIKRLSGTTQFTTQLMRNLVVSNDLTIGSNTRLFVQNTNGITNHNLNIGRNFTIQDNALYEFVTNTTTFDGTEDATLYIGDITAITNPTYTDPEGAAAYADWEHPFYNFTVNKPQDKTLFFSSKDPGDAGNTTDVKTVTGGKNIRDWRSNLVKVANDFELLSGRIDLVLYSLRLYDDITNYGTLAVDAVPTNAIVRTRKESVSTIRIVKTSSNAFFGNLRLNSDNTILQFTSDVYIGRMEYKHGRMNISKYNLKIDDLVVSFENEARFDFDGDGNANEAPERQKFSVADMIITDGKASDGGLSLLVNSSKTYYFPVGIGTDATELARNNSKFTPVELVVSSAPSSGYITVRPVDQVLQTTNLSGGNVLDYYWRISCTGFTTNPVFSNIYMLADDRDIPTGSFPADFYSGWVEDGIDANANGFNYDRFYEALDDVNLTRTFNNYTFSTNKWIRFNNTGADVPPTTTLVGGNFTAGVSNRFTGNPRVFYSRVVAGNWTTTSTWSFTRGGGDAGAYPVAGDVVVLRRTGAGVYSGIITVNGAQNAASVIYDDENGFSSGCPRLVFGSGSGFAAFNSNFGVVGVAPTHDDEIALDGQHHSACVSYDLNTGYSGQFPAGDWGSFNRHPNALVIYTNQSATTQTLSSTAVEYPQVWFDPPNARGFKLPPADVTFNGSVIIPYDNSLYVNEGADGDVLFKSRLQLGHVTTFRGGNFYFPGNSTGNRTVTIEGNLLLYNNTSYNQRLMISSPATGTNIHKLICKGNINISGTTGTLNLGSGSSSETNVELELQGISNNSFTNMGSATLYRIIMNKGEDQSSSFAFNNNFSLVGTTTGIGVKKAIELQNGTLILNNSAINVNLSTGNDNFTIPSTSGFEVRQGTANVSGNSGISLDGKLLVSGGNLNMAGGNNFIEYSASGNAELEISSGNLTVGSQIRRKTTTEEGILKYTQTGGTVILGQFSAPVTNRGVLEILNSGSSFTMGNNTRIIIANAQTNATLPAVYLNPQNYSLGAGSEIQFGNSNTLANQTIGLFSEIPLKNITSNNASNNNPKVKLWYKDITIDENVSIAANTELNADNWNVTVNGNWTNNGNYLPVTNTTYFSGSTNQAINGTTNFYNFVKNTSNTINVNSNIVVQNEFNLLQGTLNDNSNEISVYGNLNNAGLHVYGGVGDGIIMRGTRKQEMVSTGQWGRITINNPEGVGVETTANSIIINNAVKHVSGVFDIGKNLLVMNQNAVFIEGNPFSKANMVQSFISFTDNGIKKYFPSSFTGQFVYPIGSKGKYTPVAMNISSTGAGSIRVKAADEIHPTIIDDTESCDPNLIDQENVLAFYWTIDANDGLSNFNADITMKHLPADANFTVPYSLNEYLSAKLILGTTSWNKFGYESYDELNSELKFNFLNADATSLNGDYTAGVEVACGGAIPDNIPQFITTGIGNWTDNTKWTTYPVPGGPVPTGGPRGAIAIIDTPHRILLNQNYIVSYRTTINGVLDAGSSFAQRLGNVDGTGELYLERGDMPAAVYDDFVLANTGTFHFGGNTSYDILSNLPIINNLTLSGTGERRFPNMDLVLRGNFTIDGANNTLIARNEHNKKMEVRRNITFNNGRFIAGTGASSIFEVSGMQQQTISGTNSFTGINAFNHFVMNNSYGLVLARPVDIDQTLTFTNGVISNNETNVLTMHNTNETAITGANSNRYVNGVLAKRVLTSGNFGFPVGNNGRYGRVEINNIAQTNASDYWYAQYFNTNPNNAGLDPNSFASPLQVVSQNEYWRINGPAGANAYVRLRWDALSGASSDENERNDMRVAEWKSGNSRWEAAHLNQTASGSQASGTITTATTLVPLTGNHFFTIGATTIYENTWQGTVIAERTNWFNTSNWSLGRVPTSLTNTVIPTNPLGGSYFPVITGTVTANTLRLTINTGAEVVVDPSASLTVSGDLINNGTIRLNSPSNNGLHGTLIDNGNSSGTGNILIQRFLKKHAYQYVSAPITGGNASSGLFTTFGSAFNANFYSYNEAADLNGNPATAPSGPYNSDNLAAGWQFVQRRSIDPSVPMQASKGYAFYTDIDGMVTFNGNMAQLNTGNKPVTGLSFTNNDPMPGGSTTYYDGWHLIGNPYPSCIDWDLISSGITNLDNAIYVWDGTQYASYVNGITGGSGTQNNIIAPIQGFFVRAHTNNASVQINNSHRLHSSTATFKSKKQGPVHDNLISMKLLANGKSDETVVYFKSNADAEFDGAYDAFKLFSWDNNPANTYNKDVPHLFTITPAGKTALSINAMPEALLETTVVPLGIRLGTSGEYTIQIASVNFSASHVYLIDKLENKEIPLESGLNYTFNFTAGDNRTRFELRFAANNPPAIVVSVPDQSVNEKSTFAFTLAENSFVERDLGDAIVEYRAGLAGNTNLPSWLSFDNLTKTFSGTPQNDDVGSFEISVSALDKLGALTSQTFVLEVINVNDPPVLKGKVTNQSVNEKEAYSYALPGNLFVDIDKNDVLTMSASLANGNPLPAWLNFNAQGTVFAGTPQNSDVGTIELKITATDKAGASVSDYFALEVLNVNDAPVLNGKIPDQEIDHKKNYSYKLPVDLFLDIDKNDELGYAVTLANGLPLPSWLTFNQQEMTVGGVAENTGEYELLVKATDKAGATASDIYKLTVKALTSIGNIEGIAFKVFPNPTEGVLFVDLGGKFDGFELSVIDANGRLVIRKLANQSISELNIKRQQAGIYYVTISKNGAAKVFKVIKL